MNKKKLVKLIVLSAIIILISGYALGLALRYQALMNSINEKQAKIKSLTMSIKKERKNKYNISLAGANFLKNAYFDRKKEYFEDYIRTIFDKYRVTVKIYRSKMDEKDYAEIYLNFKSSVYDFFKLLDNIENGERLVVIREVSVSRQEFPDLDVNMRLIGYYKNNNSGKGHE